MRGELPGSPKMPEGARNKGEGNKAPVVDGYSELQLLLDKEYKCPVCERAFKVKAVRAGVAQSAGMDMDLRPLYKNIDPIKYKIIECPVCGYADMESRFNNVLQKEAAILREKSIKWDTGAPLEEISRDYRDAYGYFKSALRCCLIRSAKSSHRAYVSLNEAWLLRGWREQVLSEGKIVLENDPMSEEEERKLIKYTLRNLKEAEMKEDFPINGMSEGTFDYLMAVLCFRQDEINDAGRYILRSLQNRSLKPGIRPMAEDLRDMIKEKKHRMSSGS